MAPPTPYAFKPPFLVRHAARSCLSEDEQAAHLCCTVILFDRLTEIVCAPDSEQEPT